MAEIEMEDIICLLTISEGEIWGYTLDPVGVDGVFFFLYTDLALALFFATILALG